MSVILISVFPSFSATSPLRAIVISPCSFNVARLVRNSFVSSGILTPDISFIACILSLPAIAELVSSLYDIPKASAISLAFLMLTPTTSNLPDSLLNVARLFDDSSIASCRPSTLLVAIYIISSGLFNAPIAPPTTCRLAAISSAPSGENTLSATWKTLSTLILNSVDFLTIFSKPRIPFWKPNSFNFSTLSCKPLIVVCDCKPSSNDLFPASPIAVVAPLAPIPTFSNDL